MFHHRFHEKQPEYSSKKIPQIERTVIKSSRYLRVLLLVALVWLLGVEFAEFEFNRIDVFHTGEIIILLILILSVGLLVEVVSQMHSVWPLQKIIKRLITMMLQRIENSVTKFAKFFRLAIAATLILLVGVEAAEFDFRISDTFHIGEIIIYFVLLGSLGLLVEVILHAHKKQRHSIELLNFKHQMSLQLLSYQSWESLTGLIAKQLAEVVEAKAAYLFLNQPMTSRLEPIGEWVAYPKSLANYETLNKFV